MGNSRTADKFVVRLPDGLRSRAKDQAEDSHISLNSLIVQALVDKLDRTKRQETLLDALENASNGPGQEKTAAPRLIGWRTADYLEETNDHKVARNWAPNVAVLPIFEGDTITRLPHVPVEVSP
ncbi:Arc family DNA-binding protein [Ectopseudomonas mendocina]|nr:Arc family DNA-binding protein [Pseudomonas mendocina]